MQNDSNSRKTNIHVPSQSAFVCLTLIAPSLQWKTHSSISLTLLNMNFYFALLAMHSFHFSQVENAKQKLTQKKMAAIKITENDKIALCTVLQFKIGD